MQQNKYDDQDFFDQYGAMLRSIKGLSAAGEWHVLQRMLPDFHGKSVLDLGCGYGWHCIHAKEQGAERVVGIDLSQRMLNRAKEYSQGLFIDYRQLPIEDIAFAPEEFDIVISSLAFHYIQHIDTVFRKVYHILKPGGHVVFSMEHPVFTARAEQDWFCDEQGKRLHWPLDNYQDEGMRVATFLQHNVIKYHRTLETILNAVISSGFAIQQISEPPPSAEALAMYPEMRDELRRPIFLIVSAIKHRFPAGTENAAEQEV